jgi:superfamily II DNA or RNA helicase
VLIACHREKLVKQSRKALYDWYGIIAEPIFAETRSLGPSQVFTGMIETLHRRFAKNQNYIRDLGLLVVDEAHLGGFSKLIAQHPELLVIGFTATPIAASRKKPLNGIYSEIVCGPHINDLIHEGALCANITHRVKDPIDRKQLKVRNGEYDDTFMGNLLSSTKHVNNTVEAYLRFCSGQRAIVFNCNIAHSKVVCDAFAAAGMPARHVDGYMPKDQVEDGLRWLEQTPGAILCNVGIATTGIDIPALECVIINKATKSLPLYLQMCGRGSRPFPDKKHFTIIDIGRNYMEHGDWSNDRDWSDWFHNPEKPREAGGVAPVKECPECEALIHASVRVCPFCKADVAAVPVYDDEMIEFETVIQGKPLSLDVPSLVVQTQQRGAKEYATLHEIKVQVVAQAKREWGLRKITDAHAYKLLELYQEQVAAWCKVRGKAYNAWHKQISTQWFFQELERVYSWKPAPLALAI